MGRSAEGSGMAGRAPRAAPRGRWLWRAAALLLAALLPRAARAAPLLYSSSGHYYEAVRQANGLTWDQANAAANARMYNGMPGHLAVIPTPAVNTFLAQHFPQAINDGYWLGGFQPHGLLDPAAGWQWVTGAPFDFTNWSTIGGVQPDDYYGPGTGDQDEDRLHFWWQAGGTWDDLSRLDNSPLGYMVEYEPAPSADAPTITGYTTAASPAAALLSATPGTPLLITGANLGTSGTVLFDGLLLPAAAATWTPTQILVWAPTALSYPFPTAVTVRVDRQQAHGPPFMLTAPVPGQDNLLANASFEYPSSSGAPFSSGYVYGQPLGHGSGFHDYTLPGWRIPIGTVDVVQQYWPAAPGQGRQSIDLVGTPYPAILAQTFFTTVGQEYLFSGWIAHNPGVSEARADVYLNDSFFVELHHQGFTTPSDMEWTPFASRFRATDPQTTLAIEDVTGINYLQGTALDGLSVTPAPN